MKPPPLPLRLLQRRSARALLASLMVHGVVVWLLWANPPEVPSKKRLEHAEVPTLVWFDVPPTPSAAVVPQTVPAGAPTPSPAKKQHSSAKQKRQPRLATQRPTSAPNSDSSSPSDLPRQVDLLPRLEALAPAALPAFGGTTTTNTGSPPAEYLREEAGLRAQGTVKSLLRQGLAEAKLNDGVVEPAVAALHAALNKAVEEVPEYLDPKTGSEKVRAFTRSWQVGAERFGKTGVAYDDPAGTRDDGVSAQVRAAANAGSWQATEFAAKLSGGARLREFAQGATDNGLTVRVAIDLAPQGLEKVSLVFGSGYKAFDEWVVTQATTSARARSEEAGVLRAKKRVRSLWDYSGKITYLRKTDKIKPEDLLYLIPMSIPGLTAGTFDEVTGTAYYVDFRYPHYKCQAKLVATEDLDE